MTVDASADNAGLGTREKANAEHSLGERETDTPRCRCKHSKNSGRTPKRANCYRGRTSKWLRIPKPIYVCVVLSINK